MDITRLRPTHLLNSSAKDVIILNVFFFFAKQEHWCVEKINDTLLPNLLRLTDLFEGGRKLDLTSFESLNEPQISQLTKIMHNTKAVDIKLAFRKESTLVYLNNFPSLQKLRINYDTPNIPLEPNNPLDLKTLIIHASRQPTAIPITEAILRTMPKIEEFILYDGNLWPHTLSLLAPLKLSAFHLINTKLLVDYPMKRFFNAIYFKPTLRSLKLITQKHDESLLQSTHEFLSEIILNPKSEVENLAFTLDQCYRQPLEHLKLLPKLKKLTIYYSAIYRTDRLEALLKVVQTLSLREVKFREYFDTPPSVGSSKQLLESIEQRSQAYMLMIRASVTHAKVETVDHTTK